MSSRTLDPAGVRGFYDRLGKLLDVGDAFEAEAKREALRLMAAKAGDRILNVGAGTGNEQATLVEAAGPEGLVVDVDVSPVMLGLTRDRTGAPVVRGDARQLPFQDATFDSVVSTYVLEILSADDIAAAVADMHRVLVPDGRVVLVSLAPGTTAGSRALVAAWDAVYSLHPALTGGCRSVPIPLEQVLRETGFQEVASRTIVQRGFPSEVATGVR